MKMLRNLRVLLVFLATIVGSYATAQEYGTVDTRSNIKVRYLPNIADITLGTEHEAREAALLQIKGALQRAPGSLYRVIWSDGSSELSYVVCNIGTGCARAVKGSQLNPDGSKAPDSGATYVPPSGSGGGGGVADGGGGSTGTGGGAIVGPGGGWACTRANKGIPQCYFVLK